jgi:[ribosomal protein S5]-alanine N-acetyltransferase
MQFIQLKEKHRPQLLEFETKNKRWFEQLIAARAPDFYSEAGITQHIRECTQGYQNGKFFAGIVVHNEQIIARANLKDILIGQSAQVGYRVAQQYCGKGVASFALQQLIKTAQVGFKLKQLSAQVLENNPASIRVLAKQGFITSNTLKDGQYINSQYLSCTEYILAL